MGEGYRGSEANSEGLTAQVGSGEGGKLCPETIVVDGPSCARELRSRGRGARDRDTYGRCSVRLQS